MEKAKQETATAQPAVPPSNVQIDSVIDKTLEVLQQEASQTTLVKDIETLLEDSKKFLHEKNEDEKIQKFILHSQQSAKDAAQIVPQGMKGATTELQASQKSIETRASLLSEKLKTVALEIIESTEFRALLVEMIGIIQDTVRKDLPSTSTLDLPADILKHKLEKPAKTTTEAIKESAQEVVNQTTEALGKFTSNISVDLNNANIPVTEEQKRLLNERWRSLLKKLARDKNFHRATISLLDLYEELKEHSLFLSAKVEETAEQLKGTRSLRALMHESFDIVSEWTGREALDQFSVDLDKLFERIKNDPEFNEHIKRFKEYMSEVLENPVLLENEDYVRRLEKLVNHQIDLLASLGKENEVKIVLNDANDLLKKITHDPATNRLIQDFQRLTTDAMYDSRGRFSLSVTAETLQSIKSVIVPVLVKQLDKVPLSQVEGSNATYDWILDNLILNGREILPEHVSIDFRTHLDVNLKDLSQKDVAVALLTMTFSKFQTRIRDVLFAFRRKVFPHMNDEGILDVDLEGSQIIIEWELRIPKGRGPVYFKVNRVTVDLGSSKLKVRETKHDFLYNILSPLFSGQIKKSFQDAISKNLFVALDNVNEQLNVLVRNNFDQQHGTKIAE